MSADVTRPSYTLTALFCALVLVSRAFSGPMHFSFAFAFGSAGEEPGEFHKPAGLTVDPNGNIYVADTGNNRICKFDRSGQLITFIGGFGWESEQFQHPVDIYTDEGLNVFVADYENRRIERYDKDLNWISSIHSSPSLDENLQFGFPRSVCLSLHNDLFVVDGENNRILKLNALREPVLSFGDYDWGEGDLAEPAQIFISRSDEVYVTDISAGLVRIYDYYGNYVTRIGDGVLDRPTGLCFIAGGLLCVADEGGDCLFFFDRSGRLLLTLGSPGEKLGAFQNPGDVAAQRNRVYVADTDNHRVQVFEIRTGDTSQP